MKNEYKGRIDFRNTMLDRHMSVYSITKPLVIGHCGVVHSLKIACKKNIFFGKFSFASSI